MLPELSETTTSWLQTAAVVISILGSAFAVIRHITSRFDRAEQNAKDQADRVERFAKAQFEQAERYANGRADTAEAGHRELKADMHRKIDELGAAVNTRFDDLKEIIIARTGNPPTAGSRADEQPSRLRPSRSAGSAAAIRTDRRKAAQG